MSIFKRKESPPTKTKSFRKDIQALRALAVVAVVLYHLWPNRLTGGFAGVDIFFVISGYLMTISILRRLSPLIEKRTATIKSIASLLANFYAHRIRRLIPAALLSLVGILVLALLTDNFNVIITNAKNVLSAATFWQNWLLASDSLNYLQQDNLIVASQHFWSLSLEEQFYLAWPLFLIVASLITVNIVVLFKKQRISGIIIPITLAILGSLAYGVWLTHTDQTVAYYSTPARVWELMVGGFIALLPTIKNYDLKLLLPYAGLVVCLYSLFFIDASSFPGWWALLPTIGTAMIILGGDGKPASPLAFEKVFRWRPIQWIGNISYSLYLWHWPLIIFLPILIHHDINGPHGTLFKVGIIFISLIVAHLSYLFVEQPSQKLRLKLRYIYILFFVAIGLIVGASLTIQRHTENQIDSNMASLHTAALDENNICFGARATLNQDECKDTFGHKDSAYAQLGSSDDYLNILSEQRDCKKITLDEATIDNIGNYCSFGDAAAQKTILLIGDSHASQYINAFDAIGKKYHYKVDHFASQSCSTDWKTMTQTTLCQKQWQLIQDRIVSAYENNPQSFVVLSTLWLSYYDISNLVQSLDDMPSDIQRVLIKDLPRPPKDLISSCYSMGSSCQYDRKAATTKVDSILSELSRNNILKDWNVIDIDSTFCHDDSCYGYIGNIPLFRNSKIQQGSSDIINSHVNGSYSRSMAPVFVQKLQKLDLLE